tara:strand:+ start:1674 stop:2030 length:357 start_codon:yes stop_codon:yes gene_type:complete
MKKEEMEDGIELIMQLLTALLRALGKAGDAIRSGALEDKDREINRAILILHALQESVTVGKEKGYELPKKLDDLYLYCLRKCARAKKLNDADTLVHVQAVIAEIATGWACLPMAKEVA